MDSRKVYLDEVSRLGESREQGRSIAFIISRPDFPILFVAVKVLLWIRQIFGL